MKNPFKRLLSPEELEQKKKEKQAYTEELYKARIQNARKRGRQAGHTQQAGSHGIKATLGTIGKGFNMVGDYGLQIQDNLSNMFDLGTSTRKKRKQK